MNFSPVVFREYRSSMSIVEYTDLLRRIDGIRNISDGHDILVEVSAPETVMSWSGKAKDYSKFTVSARIVAKEESSSIRLRIQYLPDRNAAGYRGACIMLALLMFGAGVVHLISSVSSRGMNAIADMGESSYIGWFVVGAFALLGFWLHSTPQVFPSPLSAGVDELLLKPLGATQSRWHPSFRERLGYIE